LLTPIGSQFSSGGITPDFTLGVAFCSIWSSTKDLTFIFSLDLAPLLNWEPWKEHEKGLYLAASLRSHAQGVLGDLADDKKVTTTIWFVHLKRDLHRQIRWSYTGYS
jgi:hypothetical protein